jgi:ABC-2 type transport system permease protein
VKPEQAGSRPAPGTPAGVCGPASASRRPRQFLVFALVLLSELFRLRVEWFWYLVQMSFFPVVMIGFIYFLWGDPRAAQFAVTGSLVVTMSTAAMLSLGQHVGWLKDTNAYEHYAALPVGKGVFVLAIATRGVILAMPSVLTVALLGRLLLGVHLTALSILVLIVAAYAMSGIGAFIGFWSRDGRASGMTTQVVATAIIYLAPVYIPLERLPVALRFVAQFFPTTYAASALRAVGDAARTAELWRDVAVLGIFALVSLLLVPRRLDWRQ